MLQAMSELALLCDHSRKNQMLPFKFASEPWKLGIEFAAIDPLHLQVTLALMIWAHI